MKKGFTLIELLAVIVILAILALIVTPIVLNIINNAKAGADKRSIEQYAKVLEQSYYENKIVGNSISLASYVASRDLINNISYEGNKVECDSYKVNNGDIELYNCTVDGGSNYYNFVNGKVEKVDEKETTSEKELVFNENIICNAVTKSLITTGNLPSGNYNIGDEYVCKVKEDTLYHFFVVGTENDNVNLIMDRNISDNTMWIYWSPSNYYGPATAMSVIYNATKDWSNIPNIIINYNDEGRTTDYGYNSIVTSNNITKIIYKNLEESQVYENLKARLPKYNEVYGEDRCTNNENSCPLWLYNYLSETNRIFGYWTLSSDGTAYNKAFAVNHNGAVESYIVGYYNYALEYAYHGVRPVISVPKNKIRN